jgi:nucleotide-binding universal stress UspA family protein
MIPTFKRILYATDLSPNARHAFGYAASLAHKYDAKITIVHVLEQISESLSGQMAAMFGKERWVELQTRHANEAREAIRVRLDQFCAEMLSEHQACPFVVDEIVVLNGEPVEQILRQVAKTQCDLVVMGTRGYGLLADAMLGSTARRVVRRSLVPVMVIRLPKADGER